MRKTRGNRPRSGRGPSRALEAWAEGVFRDSAEALALVGGRPPAVLWCNNSCRDLAGDCGAAALGLPAALPSASCLRVRLGERDLQLGIMALPGAADRWLVMAKDVTEEARTRSFLQSIVENIPDMVFVKDARELRFLLFNRAGEELLGYRRGELLGKNDYDFFATREADFFTARDRHVLASKGILDIPEEPIHTRRGGRRTLHTKKIAILDEKGEPRYLLGISADVTEEKRAGEELRELVEAAAHDLKGHLRRITVFGDMLFSEGSADPRVRRMSEAARRALELVDALVRLGSLSRQALRPERVDLSVMARQVFDELRGPEPGREVELVVAEGLSAYADREMARLLVSCLLSNAWKFTSTRPRARIEVGRGGGPSGFAMFFVKDDGVGFDMASAGDVFKLFTRQHSEAEFPGSGVGLAMAKRVVTRHGGTMRIESAPGQGATVFFSLPEATP